MSNKQSLWYDLNKEEKIKRIRQSRLKGDSFAQISEELLGNAKNKSTIWTWAQRNMTTMDIYPKMRSLPQEPYGNFTDVERWVIFDIITSLFARLDAMSEHLLIEIQKIHNDQRDKFTTTAGFLDELETRIIESIRANTAIISSNVSRVVSTTAPPPPRTRQVGVSSPPPPPSVALPSQSTVGSGTIAELRTDFEEMTMEEITALSADFLEALTPVDRNRLQERVKELKRIEKMSPEEREAYINKKREEKERSEAVEGLGSSLTAMLDDTESLFARMRRAADDSEVSGTGTFGKFTIDYKYFYCFACGKMNRTEEEILEKCTYCDATTDQLVPDEEKTNYTYWECLSKKSREPIDLNYTRGKQIVVKSRWKIPVGQKFTSSECSKEDIRDITSAVVVKADPDKQFSHYLALFRMYSQLNFQGNLNFLISELSKEVQRMPDQISMEAANTQALLITKNVRNTLVWLENYISQQKEPESQEIKIQIRNLLQDISLLEDPESPQELYKASEVGYIMSKIDQILNRLTTLLLNLEKQVLVPASWKCSECGNVFEIKDRNKFPERCVLCGKIITKLERVIK